MVDSCQVYFIWHFKMKFHFIQKMTQETVHFKWNIFYFKLLKWNYLNLFSECPSYNRFAHFTFFTNKHLGPCTPLGSVINIFPVNYNFPIKIFPLIKKTRISTTNLCQGHLLPMHFKFLGSNHYSCTLSIILKCLLFHRRIIPMNVCMYEWMNEYVYLSC